MDPTRLTLRLPADARAFIAAQSQRNGSSQNSEIIRCIRDRMEILERQASTGPEFGDTNPVEAEAKDINGDASNGAR